MKRALFAFLVGGLTLTSCSNDDDSIPEEKSLEIPATYSFTRNGESTVYYGGQTTRLVMTKELLGAFTDVDNATEESLSNMFSNTNSPFQEAALNESSKSIKSKVAASYEYFATNTVEQNAIQADFESWISQQANEVYPRWNENASAGVAGQILDGTRTRYVNAKGLELNQAVAKTLIGALLTDQAINNYLSPAVLDEGDNVANNDQEITEEGENFTTMEHKWDEAYGYVFGDPSIPTEDPMSVLNESEDHLLFSYLGQVDADEDFSGIAEETFEAFKTGRAAIVAGDYELRNEQIEIIQENISLVSAVRAVHYLQEGKNKIEAGNRTSAFHALSEGFGFLYSLRFSHNPATDQPYISKEKINSYKEQLMNANGFWDVTPETLQTISEEIATAYGITVAQAAE